jgi:hypothetical protein
VVRHHDVHLTPKEFDLLVYLARHPGKVATHRTLLSAIWGGQSTEQIEYLRLVRRPVAQEAGIGSLVTALHRHRTMGRIPLRAGELIFCNRVTADTYLAADPANTITRSCP